MYPVTVLVLGVAVTHTFVERFALPAILGLSALLALGLRRVLTRDSVILAIAGLLLCLAPLHAFQHLRRSHGTPVTRYSPSYAAAIHDTDNDVFSALPITAKIVTDDVELHLLMMKYAPEKVLSRLELLDLVETPSPAGRTNIPEMVALGIRTGLGLPTVTLPQLGAQNAPFFFVCCRNGAKPDSRAVATLKDNGNGAAVSAGSYRDWQVYAVRPIWERRNP